MEILEKWPHSKIVAGELDLSQPSGFEQIYQISNFKIHPEYQGEGNNFANDICLLFLDENLEFNENVTKITINTNETNTEPGTLCSISGWGTRVVRLI